MTGSAEIPSDFEVPAGAGSRYRARGRWHIRRVARDWRAAHSAASPAERRPGSIGTRAALPVLMSRTTRFLSTPCARARRADRDRRGACRWLPMTMSPGSSPRRCAGPPCSTLETRSTNWPLTFMLSPVKPKARQGRFARRRGHRFATRCGRRLASIRQRRPASRRGLPLRARSTSARTRVLPAPSQPPLALGRQVGPHLRPLGRHDRGELRRSAGSGPRRLAPGHPAIAGRVHINDVARRGNGRRAAGLGGTWSA